MENSIALQLLLQVVLIALNAIFACAEIAVISINEGKLEKMADEGNKKAKRLYNLTANPAKFLATIQVAITLSGFLGSAFAADNFSEKLVSVLLRLGIGIPEETLSTISLILITLILSYFTLVFGELVPKRLAMKNSEKLALGMSALITFISKLFAPIVWLLTVSTNGLLRLLGVDPNSEDDTVTEEEILLMTEQGHKSGTIDEGESELIRNVFEFDDLTVEEICTHRREAAVLWMDETVEEWEKTIHQSRHSMYPICGDSVDNIIGVLNAKDYFRLEDKSRESVMKNAVREPYFVHESMKADKLFTKMKKNASHFAIVLDEYGGMCGIVTITDLVEQLVGDFDDDEFREAEMEIERLDSRTWKILGTAPLDDVARALEIELPSDDFDTFNGYVISLLGEIPQDGTKTKIETGDMSIQVLDVKRHCITKAIVRITKTAEENADDKSDSAKTSAKSDKVSTKSKEEQKS